MIGSRDNRKEWLFLLSILVFAFSIRLWNINWSLPEIYEEAYPFHIAWKFWNWDGQGFDFNPHFFNYPALTFYVQFLVQTFHYLIGSVLGLYPNVQAYHQAYVNDPSTFIVLGRLVSVFFDVSTIIVLYIIARKYFDKFVAFLVALLLSLNPIHLKQSHVISVDSALTFFSVLSLYFILKLYNQPKKKWYILSGVAIGLATASKYNGAILLIVLLTAHLMQSISRNTKQSIVSLNFLIAIALSGIVFIVINPFILTHFDEFYYSFSFEQYHVATGHLGIDPSQNTSSYYFFDTIPSSVGIPIAIAAGFFFGYVVYKRKKESIILVLFPVIYLGVLVSWEMRAERYALPVLPFIVLFGSAGIVAAGRLLREKYVNKISPVFLRFIVIPILGFVCVVPPAIGVLKYQNTYLLPDTRTLAKEWMKKNMPPGKTIATLPLGMELKERNYFIVPIPFHPVLPQSVEPFYHLDLYRNFDYIIGSSFDYDRYVLDTQQYKTFINFYDSLRTTCKLLHEISPNEKRNGPTFWFFQPTPDSNQHTLDERIVNRLEQVENKQNLVNFAGKIGTIFSLKGFLGKSEQMFRLAVKYDGEHLEARRQLVLILLRQEKKEEALKHMNFYLQRNPEDGELLAARGEILLGLGQLNESEKDLMRAIAVNKNLESAYLNLTIIYGITAEKEKMIGILERYLTILPPNSERYNLVVSQIEKVKTF
ncbi:MAG: glycosyltransferase family 39 protein [Ignavibacteriae bacterium]|nr:glycosyltransferase family 39 protein [Ignavibacteriota bacterium]